MFVMCKDSAGQSEGGNSLEAVFSVSMAGFQPVTAQSGHTLSSLKLFSWTRSLEKRLLRKYMVVVLYWTGSREY